MVQPCVLEPQGVLVHLEHVLDIVYHYYQFNHIYNVVISIVSIDIIVITNNIIISSSSNSGGSSSSSSMIIMIRIIIICYVVLCLLCYCDYYD